MNLPSRARTGLNEVARLLCQQPTVVRPRRQWVDDMVAWCHQHDIDLAARLSGKTLRFDAALLAQINGVLESAKIAPLGRSLSGLASGAQAKEGVEEDKTNREINQPTAGSLAVVRTRACTTAEHYSRCGYSDAKTKRIQRFNSSRKPRQLLCVYSR